MNGFDLALIGVVALSALFAFARGIVRETIALATWIIAVVAAVACAGPVAGAFTPLDVPPVAKHVLAFTLVLVAVLLAGALFAWLLGRIVRVIGLGFVDRMLGAAFGVARGLVVVVVFALIAGVTTLPQRVWWQNATFGRPLAEAALSLKPYLPGAWADRLDFSPAGTASASVRGRVVADPAGEHGSCVES